MEFFIPALETATTTEIEATYKQLAESAHAHPAPMAERVYRIVFEKNPGEMVEATVGGHIVSTPGKGKMGKKVDNAIVLAIFKHEPWQIVTSGYMVHQTDWNNPVSVGANTIRTIERFKPEEAPVEAAAEESQPA